MEGPTPKDLADILKQSNMQGAPPLEDFAEWVKQFFVHIDKKEVAERCPQLLRDRTWNDAIEKAAQEADAIDPHLAETIRKLKRNT